MPRHCAQTPVATNLGECARRGKVVPCGRLGWSAVPGTARRESMVWPDHRMARPGAEGGDREVRAAHVRRPGAHPSHDGRRPRHDGPQHAALRAELTGSGELLDGAGPAYRADTTTLRLDGGAVATSHGALDNIHGSADRLLPGQVPGHGQGPRPRRTHFGLPRHGGKGPAVHDSAHPEQRKQFYRPRGSASGSDLGPAPLSTGSKPRQPSRSMSARWAR